MMYGSGLGAALPLLSAIHVIAMAVLLIGIILFLVWAIRTLPPEKLKLLSWWMIGIGIVLCIVTMPFMGFHAWQGVPAQSGNRMMNGNSYENENTPPMMRRYRNGDQQNASGSTASLSATSSL